MNPNAEKPSSPQPRYPNGIPDPDQAGFLMVSLPGVQVMDFDPVIDRIAKTLGRPVQFVDNEGYEHAITAGAIHPENQWIAWVEYKCKDTGPYVDIEFRLKAQVGERVPINWVVETYNPFFGCHVGYMACHGERVVVIYREKHYSYACSLGLDGSVTRVKVADQWLVTPDQITSRSDEPGLVERFSLTQLGELGSIPAAQARTEGLLPPGFDEANEFTRRIQARRKERAAKPWWKFW